jgi:pimeloyl-ACP methyl ester carboxylesterase
MIVRDIELNVRINGDGYPLIWGHGLTSSMAAEDDTNMFQWERMSELLKLVRYDARGHGESEASYKPEDYQWKNLAQDMLALADETGCERFIAGGQSMGCATSIYAAINDPQRVKALLLVNPPTAWETRAEQVSMYGKMAWMARILGGRSGL